MERAENRDWLEVQAAAPDDGIATGLVALSDGEAIGWVSVAPRESYHRLAASRTIPAIAGDNVWSVTCFVVGRQARRQGLTATLLAAAVDFARSHGALIVEAYPVAPDPAGRVPVSAAFTGIETTFLAAGFERVATTTSKAAGQPRVVVRLAV